MFATKEKRAKRYNNTVRGKSQKKDNSLLELRSVGTRAEQGGVSSGAKQKKPPSLARKRYGQIHKNKVLKKLLND